MSHFDKLSCIAFGMDGPTKGLDANSMAISPVPPIRLWGTAPRDMSEPRQRPMSKRKKLKNRYRNRPITLKRMSFKNWIKKVDNAV